MNGSWGLYERRSGAAQRYRLMSSPWMLRQPADTSVTAASARFEYAADTPDGRHVIFNANRQLLPEAPPDRTSGSTFNAVYDYDRATGDLSLASTLPPGLFVTTSPSQGAFAGGSALIGLGLPGDHPVSDDGGRVFFTATVNEGSPTGPSRGTHLWVREEGTTTRLVSGSQVTGQDPLAAGGSGRFYAARSSDGAVAFFQGNGPLTDGAGPGSLYRWDASAPDGTGLTDITPDPIDEPGVLGPAAVSDDAESVYFVATGELATGATRGANNLYLWRQGEGVRFIATLAGGNLDVNMWRLDFRNGGRAARLSADGERLLFASHAQLDPSSDNTEPTAEACANPSVAGEGCRQIYVYDAPSDRISCMTCVAGQAPAADANLFGNAIARGQEANERPQNLPLRLPRNLSDDGTRAYFETSRKLAPADTNGMLDVYEWHDPELDGNGDLRLMSPGTGPHEARFLDASDSGDDVFFETRERLVGIDTDDQVDLYDARVGGGIAAQNPPPVTPCAGDACQGAATGPPFLPGPVSGDTTGPGDLRPGPRASFSVVALSRKQRKRLALGRRIVMRVRVNQAGTVRLVARAKVGNRMRVVARQSRAASRAGRARVGVRLSRPARRQLARRRKLGVKLTVRFTGVREARTSNVSLRRAPRKGQRRAR